MSLSVRLVVLDVDGTLLDPAHQLRPRVAAAVRAVRASGMEVAFATGKLLQSVRPLLTALDISGPQIALNGAATVDAETGMPLRFAPLRRDAVATIVQTVRRADPRVLVSLFALDAIYMDEEHPLAGIFALYGEGTPRIVPDLLSEALPPTAKVLLAGAPAQLAALRAKVAPLMPERVSITTTTPDFLEFFDAAAGKGQALAALRAHLGLPREAVLAIGDGENDVPLFHEAGHSVAMANGTAETRVAADCVAPSNDEDGVAVVLERLLAVHTEQAG